MKIKLSGVFYWLKVNIFQVRTIYILLILACLSFVIVKFSLLPPGASVSEIETYKGAITLDSIIADPLFLPYKVAILIFDTFFHSVRFVRCISIIIFGISAISIYRLLKRWHSSRIALFATALFVSNATVLSIARLGEPLVMVLGWSIILSVLLWLQHGNHSKNALILLGLITAAYLYVPGAPYFYLLMIVVFGKSFIRQIKRISIKFKLIVFFISFLLLLPLAVASFRDINILKEWLLLPNNFEASESIRNILRVPSAFIYRSPINPAIGVGRLPVFDLVSGGLFLLGLYAYQKYLKLERTKIMIVTALLAITLGALGQVTYAVAILLPYAFIVIAAGISYLLDEWYKVFPKNPFARNFGLVMIVLLVLSSVYYQSFRFLVVWQHAPETKETYSQPRLIQ